MFKVRFIAAFIFCLFSIHANSQSQYIHPGDTMLRKGFLSKQEALDTVWNKLASRKPQTLIIYTLPDSLYYAEIRKSKPNMAVQIMHGLWVGYWYKVSKSFVKTRKLLKKNKINLNRVKRDTVLVSKLATEGEILRIEQYFKKSKSQWYIQIYIWKIAGKWYLFDLIRLEQDNTRIR